MLVGVQDTALQQVAERRGDGMGDVPVETALGLAAGHGDKGTGTTEDDLYVVHDETAIKGYRDVGQQLAVNSGSGNVDVGDLHEHPPREPVPGTLQVEPVKYTINAADLSRVCTECGLDLARAEAARRRQRFACHTVDTTGRVESTLQWRHREVGGGQDIGREEGLTRLFPVTPCAVFGNPLASVADLAIGFEESRSFGSDLDDFDDDDELDDDELEDFDDDDDDDNEDDDFDDDDDEDDDFDAAFDDGADDDDAFEDGDDDADLDEESDGFSANGDTLDEDDADYEEFDP